MLDDPATTPTTPIAKRTRRKPEAAEREILEAAEQALQTVDFRDLTVDEIMRRTGMRRSAFYTYFADRNALALRLLDRIEAEMMVATRPWLDADADSRRALHEGLDQIVQIYARHGHVIRGIHEASYHDHEVERQYRDRFVGGFVDVVAQRLRELGRERGTPFPSPRGIAHALVTMNADVMAERLGRAPADRPRAVAKTLRHVWEQVIYGRIEDIDAGSTRERALDSRS